MLDNFSLTDLTTRKRDRQELLSLAEEVLRHGDILVIANDVDLTVSNGGTLGEEDPRLTKLYGECGRALTELEKNGHYIGFISNRASWQVARMAEDAGIKHATIIGTFGLETFYADVKNPQRGTAFIDDRIIPYNDIITEILSHIRKVVFEFTNYKDIAGKNVEIAIPFYDNNIILERKGICELFPEGFAAGYNFNLTQVDKRTELIRLMENEYRQKVKESIRKHHLLTLSLNHLWGMVHDKKSPSSPGRYSLRFEPLIKQGKAYGMIHLLQAIRRSLPKDKRMGLILFAGDSNADAEAMKANKQIVEFHNNDYIAHDPIKAFNIWVKPEHPEKNIEKYADIIVDGVKEYAELLTQLAAIANRYAQISIPSQFKQFFRL